MLPSLSAEVSGSDPFSGSDPKAGPDLVFELLHDQARVVPAEAERIREADADLGLARLVRDVVEIALRVRLVVVDRRRQHAALDGEDREDRLDRAGRAEAMAGCALRRRDPDLRSVLLAERLLDHL